MELVYGRARVADLGVRSIDVQYILIHTAASTQPGVNAAVIDDWHKRRGWSSIGYHRVVLQDGTVETGRSLSLEGAHARGLNKRSIGICCTGHGDLEPFTPAQLDSLVALCVQLMHDFDVSVDHVLGHREINRLIPVGKLARRYATHKSCPGKMVSMVDLRAELRRARHDRAIPRLE